MHYAHYAANGDRTNVQLSRNASIARSIVVIRHSRNAENAHQRSFRIIRARATWRADPLPSPPRPFRRRRRKYPRSAFVIARTDHAARRRSPVGTRFGTPDTRGNVAKVVQSRSREPITHYSETHSRHTFETRIAKRKRSAITRAKARRVRIVRESERRL